MAEGADTTAQQVRAGLGAIDALLNAMPSEVCRRVVNVLSALRGPDNKDASLKWATTAVIRRAAFPRSCIAFGFWTRGKVSKVHYIDDRFGDDRFADHFRIRVSLACDALDLWDETT